MFSFERVYITLRECRGSWEKRGKKYGFSTSLFRFVDYLVISKLLRLSSTFFSYYSKQNSRQFHTKEVTAKMKQLPLFLLRWFSLSIDTNRFFQQLQKLLLLVITVITSWNSFIDWVIETFKLPRATQLTRSTRKDPMVSRFKIN